MPAPFSHRSPPLTDHPIDPLPCVAFQEARSIFLMLVGKDESFLMH